MPASPGPIGGTVLTKLLDLGCNTGGKPTVSGTPTNPGPENFHLDGMLDAVAFVELAGEMGLNVIYRPGPYCCAEWDMGGLPWWLINEPGVAIRCCHPSYLKAVERYWTELMSRLAPLQSTRGGPIIAMQIENEYGYFGNDHKYLAWLRDLLGRLGIDVPLFTSDGTWQKLTIANGGLDWNTPNRQLRIKSRRAIGSAASLSTQGPAGLHGILGRLVRCLANRQTFHPARGGMCERA